MGTYKLKIDTILNRDGTGHWTVSPGGATSDAALIAALKNTAASVIFQNVSPAVPSGFMQFTMLPYLDGSGSSTPWGGLPSGFTPTSCQIDWRIVAGDPCVATVEFDPATVSGTQSTSGTYAFVRPTTPSAVDLQSDIPGFHLAGTTASDPSFFFFEINGSYIIAKTWWLLPADPCGTVTSRYKLVTGSPGTSPGAGYAVSGTPVPVIDSVIPVTGPIAGGTSVTITGSQFGDGATVDFGGTPATSVIIVDQFTITCVAPAHAIGLATVTVTNPT